MSVSVSVSVCSGHGVVEWQERRTLRGAGRLHRMDGWVKIKSVPTVVSRETSGHSHSATPSTKLVRQAGRAGQPHPTLAAMVTHGHGNSNVRFISIMGWEVDKHKA